MEIGHSLTGKLTCKLSSCLEHVPLFRSFAMMLRRQGNCTLLEHLLHRGLARGGDEEPWALHRGEEVDPDVYRNPFSVIVTDVYRRASQDVINFDLLGTYDEYVQRIGNDQGRSIKVVINIGTNEEQRHFPGMVPLPADCYCIRTKLPLWFDV
ncbi:hypothetical protein SELMODRAFT_425793 [Selaginella moellendorffii]|uniref:Uncharacterized protein n=1 Tax=Selaginella moellendorffii TaxID=88036 RepID=D8SUB5_SELML|nr:hypothetical protein SELMODRAFT_425793 [Selaginella moellendorffii]